MSSRVSSDAEIIVACNVGDVPPGGVHRIEGETPIAIFNVDGVLYAIDDTCTHANASLSEGDLDGCAVECPWHASSFDLRTGKPSSLPASKPVRTHAVEVREDIVVVHVGIAPDWSANETRRTS